MQRTRLLSSALRARRAVRHVLVLVAVALLAAGCAPKKNLPPIQPAEACPVPPSATGPAAEPEEVVELPIPPADDGVPLTPQEWAALNSTGELDKDLTPEARRDVELHFKYFTHRARGTFERYLKRSQNYLPHIREVFRQQGIPEEIAYLAIVESGFNPNAVSSAGAVGVWQFMPYTGMRYGLSYNWWMDERRDPYKSARAAADYLQKLYGDFGDWHLAMAAYNAGEGKISRALEGTGAEGFFDLRAKNHMLDGKAQLKDETRQYVPRFIAVAKIMRNLESLGFQAPDYSCPPKLEQLRVKPGTDLMALAQAMGQNWNDFSANNPAFRRYISPPDAHATVYVHPMHLEAATAFLSKPQQRSYAGWRVYKVRQGDTLDRIGKRCGVPVSVLKRVNKASGKLQVGQELMIPGGGDASDFTAQAETPASKSAASAKGGKAVADKQDKPEKSDKSDRPSSARTRDIAERRATYIVKQGDTLYGIAKAQGSSVETLQKANGLSGIALQLGQKLYIPDAGAEATAIARQEAEAANKAIVASASRGGAERAATPVAVATASKSAGAKPAAAPVGRAIVYKVQEGDTMWAIARKFNVPPKDLLRWNNLERDAQLKPGDQITVHAAQ
ncbi:LysM peptidoglycan-binding domain-containing protein [Nitratidesulfovibrio liaohensis]|uniref:LysM peptidoglycan-binding domain-containing protein n=1 Tax=Nitratidesulfovibrio liaohensis TaxID=2604158 RepID=UPI00141FB2AC|nr:LysM peptidoglycan-binding domain-containing protein [Nitratidesulfovibrio liaohensis]NHZ47381.1 LysM peptidoglycan-binding domain-containing protein [Nitratidesulfovibrio liaohensis]